MNLPLHAQHTALGADMADFAGYAMPMHYGDIITEHRAVRQACGLFDCSHMGEFLLRGENAAAALDALLTNRFDNLAPGRARYGLLCCENGGVVDDLIVLCMDKTRYLLIVNASNRQKDFDWIQDHLPAGVTLEDQSDDTALLALQGPKAEAVLASLGVEGLPRRYFDFCTDVVVAGVPCLLSRTGYTGEDGFELACKPPDAPRLWDALMAAGKPFGLLPCGLGARDTLRLEAGLPLYGHELGADITPLEAGLGFAVKTGKDHFIGREALLGAPRRCLAGLRATGRGIMRQGCPVLLDGASIGVCTSGTFCPSLEVAAAMALLDMPAPPPPGTAVAVNVRGRMLDAEIVPLPLYKRAALPILTTNVRQPYQGFDVELWRDAGDVDMTLTGGGTFRCQWGDGKAGNVLFRTGKKLDCTQTHRELGEITINYGCDYHPAGISYLCMYGWSLDPMVEFYVVDAWGNWRPPGGVSKGQVVIDGGTYDIYETIRTEKPSIRGTKTFPQFWSVRTEMKTAGTISVSQHFKVWEDFGMTLGKLYEISLCIEGFESSGAAHVYRHKLVMGDTVLE